MFDQIVIIYKSSQLTGDVRYLVEYQLLARLHKLTGKRIPCQIRNDNIWIAINVNIPNEPRHPQTKRAHNYLLFVLNTLN